MAVYLISYDIKEYNKDDDQKVINALTKMRATRCLYSEWLLESNDSAEDIARVIESELRNGDRLLVVPLAAPCVYLNLLNEQRSLALLERV